MPPLSPHAVVFIRLSGYLRPVRQKKRKSFPNYGPSAEFGERIRAIRREHRATQQQVGKILGVAHSYVSGVELGVLAPFLPHRLRRFAIHFKCDLDPLQDLALRHHRSLKIPLKKTTPNVNEAVYLLAGAIESRRLNDEEGRKLLRYVRRLTRDERS